MTEVIGFFPPKWAKNERINYETKTIGQTAIRYPRLTDEQMKSLTTYMKEEAYLVMQQLSLYQIVSSIDRAIHRLLRKGDERTTLERQIASIGEYDEEMIRLHLTSYLQTFRQLELRKFLAEDFPNPQILEQFVPRVKGGYTKAVPSPLTTHIWSGNVPGVSLWSFISNLLVRGPIIGKVATREPFVATAFAHALYEEDEQLANACAVIFYERTDQVRHTLYDASPVVVAYGHNDTLDTIQKELKGTTRFLRYGHKMSFGIIHRETLNHYHYEETIQWMAQDIVRFNQQGCYSPQFFFVQKGAALSPKEVAPLLFHALRQLEARHPLQPLSLEEKKTIQSFHERGRIRAIQEREALFLRDREGKYSVKYEPNLQIEPSPLSRNVTIIPFDSIEEIQQLMKRFRMYLQTTSIHAPTEEMVKWANVLAQIGVTRFSSLGKMTETEAGWHHDGRMNLLDLVQFVDIDEALLHMSDRFVAYRE